MEPELIILNKIGEFINIVCYLSLVEPRFYIDPLKSFRCVHDMSAEVGCSGRRKTRWKKKRRRMKTECGASTWYS